MADGQPEVTEVRDIVAALQVWAGSRLGALGTQLWVADDLGFQLRARIGVPEEEHDRAAAHRCCLDLRAARSGRCLAMPLELGGERSAACVFVVAQAPDAAPDAASDAATIAEVRAELDRRLEALDGALQGERIARLSGTARLGDHLRTCLALAHAVEHCEAMHPVLAELHAALGRLLPARNFFVAILDESRSWLRFEYYADQYDDDDSPIPFREGRLQGSLSAFVVASGRIVRGSSIEVLEQAGLGHTLDNRQYGTRAQDWIGVPIRFGSEVLGTMVVQSYEPGFRFQDGVPNVLSMLAEALGAAVHRRRQRIELERTVTERTEALSRSLAQLHAAQGQLVEAEKLASLGQLVAGVAHEVNTPLGVALTAATHLGDRIGDLASRLESGAMRRQDLVDFLGQAREAGSMIERNLERAAGLIRSFKQVSVDRTSEGRRPFDLAEFLDGLERSSHTLWKHRPIELQVQCEPKLALDSFPGPLGQVLTNFIQNALLHAFAPEQPGRIRIVARAVDAERCEISVIDDGAGIPDAVMPHIFEPFFTTKRNRGGTGLGLQICANLVTQKLGGRTEVASTPGAGSRFTIVIPKVAPA